MLFGPNGDRLPPTDPIDRAVLDAEQRMQANLAADLYAMDGGEVRLYDARGNELPGQGSRASRIAGLDAWLGGVNP